MLILHGAATQINWSLYPYTRWDGGMITSISTLLDTQEQLIAFYLQGFIQRGGGPGIPPPTNLEIEYGNYCG